MKKLFSAFGFALFCRIVPAVEALEQEASAGSEVFSVGREMVEKI